MTDRYTPTNVYNDSTHCAKKPVTTMLTYPWKCTVLHCNHLGNTWKPLVLMTRHFDYCPSTSEGDNQSVRSSAPVVSRCFPGGYNVKLYISRGRLAWWLLAFLCCVKCCFFIYFFIQNTSHRSLLTYKNYTKHIIHAGPTHETHKTHKRFFSENIRNTYTQQEKFSPNT